MKKIAASILLLIAGKILPQAPNLLFVKGMGSQYADNGYAITTDAANNIFIGGDFFGTVDFDPGNGVANQTPVGLNDLYFAKYDAQGNYLWAKQVGTTGRETCNAIQCDKTGNIYITGYFEDLADFDPGPGTAMLNPTGAGRDFYFAKYDASGNYLWAKSLGGGNSDIGNSLCLDSVGNVYLTGYFSTLALDFDPGPGTATLTPGIFFAKYDASGNYVFARSIPSNGFKAGNAIKLDRTGQIYIAGYFGGTADFDTGVGTATLNGGNQSAFFAKYDNSGNYIFAKNLGTAVDNACGDLELDASGNIYVTGVFTGTTNFNPGSTTNTVATKGFGDIFLAKYDNNGAFQWVNTFGGIGWEGANAIAIDASNDIYFTGYFGSGTMDIDPGPANVPLTGSTSGALFLGKFNSNGNYIWAGSVGASGYTEGLDLHLDQTGNLYLCGVFANTQDFDFGSNNVSITSTNSNSDIFFAKYGSTVTGIQINETLQNDLLLFPNPASGKVTIHTTTRYSERQVISIEDLSGNTILRQETNKPDVNFDLKDLSNGVYFVKVRNTLNNSVSIKKLVLYK